MIVTTNLVQICYSSGLTVACPITDETNINGRCSLALSVYQICPRCFDGYHLIYYLKETYEVALGSPHFTEGDTAVFRQPAQVWGLLSDRTRVQPWVCVSWEPGPSHEVLCPRPVLCLHQHLFPRKPFPPSSTRNTQSLERGSHFKLI